MFNWFRKKIIQVDIESARTRDVSKNTHIYRERIVDSLENIVYNLKCAIEDKNITNDEKIGLIAESRLIHARFMDLFLNESGIFNSKDKKIIEKAMRECDQMISDMKESKDETIDIKSYVG